MFVTATFYIALPIVTQALHIFYWPVLAIVTLFFITLLVYFFYKNKNIFNISSIRQVTSVNWLFFVATGIIVFQLVSVHFDYNGVLQTYQGAVTVSHNSSTYPYFSDEWVTVGLVKYSIAHNALPLVNPLYHNVPFPNILFAFSSTLAGIFILTGLDPLTNYWILNVLFALIMCWSLFVLLRVYKVSRPLSAASMLLVLYIVSSGNLPGLWNLLPFTLGAIFLLWQIIAQELGSYNYAVGFSVLALIMYPPMAVFSILALFVQAVVGGRIDYRKYLAPFGVCAGIFATIFLFVFYHSNTTVLVILSKYIIRPNLDPGIVSYDVWNVLPLVVLPFVALGMFYIFKKRHHVLVAVVGIGTLYWLVYVFVNKVFIIEYSRIVFMTSLFLVTLAGLGLEYAVRVTGDMVGNKIKNFKTESIATGVGVFAVIICILISPWYTTGTTWKKLVLTMTDSVGHYSVFAPTSPVTAYLTPDDIRLFSDIHGENFLAPQWKGLAVGVATGNFPLETKPSTITNRYVLYHDFMKADCVTKSRIATTTHTQFVYSEKFNCPGFDIAGSSTENLFLYKTNML